jgi:hypothetical protein
MFPLCAHHIGSVIVSMHHVCPSVVDGRFDPLLGQTKTVKLVFSAFLLSTKHSGVRAMAEL